MSRATSATTGRRYGLKRVCGTWERSRAALYARRACLRRPERGDGPGRRGPTPALSDAQLLAAIRSDLARSPFQGEGHRKVHARLRILDRIRVSRTRVLRVMRAQGLLSPHRGRQGEMKAHDGTIVTSAPDVMWGTDGVRVFTAEEGWVWTFAAVDHWNAECVGWHVCKVGSRFAALEPIAQGLGRLYGSVEAELGRERAGTHGAPGGQLGERAMSGGWCSSIYGSLTCARITEPFGGYHLAGHQPIAQPADGGQVLLDRGRARARPGPVMMSRRCGERRGGVTGGARRWSARATGCGRPLCARRPPFAGAGFFAWSRRPITRLTGPAV